MRNEKRGHPNIYNEESVASEVIRFRCTPVEKRLIEIRAEKEELTISSYVRLKIGLNFQKNNADLI